MRASARSPFGWGALAAVLKTADPAGKAEAAVAASSHELDFGEWIAPPDRPARPEHPLLAPPQSMPRRRLGSDRGRIALIHALAHIEFNAIDLAFDMALRFAPAAAELGLDWRRFVADWVHVGAEEAQHFKALYNRLQTLGSTYGALPAHGGLWETADRTADDVLARLALAPLVLEARGLDVTPKIIDDLLKAGDPITASILQTIYKDEIGHVRVGAYWFERVAQARGLAPEAAFRSIVATRFRGELKPPFNAAARSEAGLPSAFYEPPPQPEAAAR